MSNHVKNGGKRILGRETSSMHSEVGRSLASFYEASTRTGKVARGKRVC